MGADIQDVKHATTWRRSSRCNPEWNCVEIGRTGTEVIIRDSKGEIALRALGNTQWAAFLAHCRMTR